MVLTAAVMQNSTCHARPAQPAIYISLEMSPQSQQEEALQLNGHSIWFFFLSQAEDALFWEQPLLRNYM